MSSDLPIACMATLKFDKLSEQQAQQIALVLGDANEAIEHKNYTLAAFRASVAAFGAAAIGGITLHFVDPSHTLHGTLLGLLVCVGIEAVNFWITTQSAIEAGAELEAHVKRLIEQQEQ